MELYCPARIAIIGTGTMGREVAWACAFHHLDTFIYDESPAQLKSAVQQVQIWLNERCSNSAEAASAFARIHSCESLAQALATADLAFENVPEVLELKRAVHAAIDRMLPKQSLQGSNASALTCSSIAAATGRPERFFNMNFSFPRFQGYVELMPNPQTSAETLRAAKAWARQLNMVPIVTRKEIMGYSMNRVWRAIKKEALFLADRGYSTAEDIDRAFMLFFGIKWGPFGMMDRIGLDSVLRVEERYHEASGEESDRPPSILRELVKQGAVGEKSGRGFYNWPNPAYQQLDWLRHSDP
jgi:3-hydroxybutyryl-CoA dehydrogenase